MKPRWEESEHVFCDLQDAARYLRRFSRIAPRRFLDAVYDTFEFLARNPAIGRRRVDLGRDDVRSFRVTGHRRYLVFYREQPDCIQILRVLHGARDLSGELAGQPD
jgi:toxin ParE1/3/4